MKEPWETIYQDMVTSIERGVAERGSHRYSDELIEIAEEAAEAAAKQLHRLQERIERLELFAGYRQ